MDRTRRQAEFNKTLQAGRERCRGLTASGWRFSQACWPLRSVAANPSKASWASEAPVYSVRDPDGVRRQVRLQDLLALAARDMQVGNLDAAERKAREALKLAPDSPDALVLLAGIDERRGRSQQAGELPQGGRTGAAAR